MVNMAKKIGLNNFKIELSKDEKRRIRDIIFDTYNVKNYQPEHSTGNGLAALCSKNIVNFIESIIINNNNMMNVL